MVLPFIIPLLGFIGIGAGVGVGGGIFSRLRKRKSATENITGTIKTVAIAGSLLVGVIVISKSL